MTHRISNGFRGRIAVIGGGASGIFSAIAAASSGIEVVVLEGTSTTLKKVSISGGGRCNVLHDTSKSISDILNGYPRGKKALSGLMNKRFTPIHAKEWFTKRGVMLKTESDGRMFPKTNSSQTIIDCITDAATQSGVKVRTREKVKSVVTSTKKREMGEHDGFVLSIKGKDGLVREDELFDCVILATGSAPLGYKLASQLGHTLVKPVPSLFTLDAKHQIKEGGVFHGLSGLSVQSARVEFRIKVPGKQKEKSLVQEGPLLITHHGISGPATLRLSAFGARHFNDVKYKGDVLVHWAPELGPAETIADMLSKTKFLHPKRKLASICPLHHPDGTSPIPKRLWSALAQESGISKDTKWAHVSNHQIRALSRTICGFVVNVTGKGVFKEEFVTAGGVSLKEIDMKTMESIKCPGLFLCGEVIDVDGITGGYNFMNCWSTGYVAGRGAAGRLTNKRMD